MRTAGLAVLAAVFVLFVPSVVADQPDPDALDRESIVDLVSEQTTECRKEKDQSICANYFSEEGVIKRLDEDGSRRDGVWFVDDSDRLCILWKGKIKPLCFFVIPQDDGTYHLIKKGKHVTSILSTEDGNTRNQ